MSIDLIEAYEQAVFDQLPPAVLLEGTRIVKTIGDVTRIFGPEPIANIDMIQDIELRSAFEQIAAYPDTIPTVIFETSRAVRMKPVRVQGKPDESLVLVAFDSSCQPETAQASASVALFDKELRFRAANEQLLKLFGYSSEHVIGKSISDFIDKDLFAVAEPNLLKALAGEERSYENLIRHRDGSELNVLVHLVPEKNSAGETTGICAMLVDTSALEKARLELLHNELRFQTAVEGSSVGVFELDFEKPDWAFAKHVEDLLGFESGAFRNSREQIRSRIHPDDLPDNDEAKLAERHGQNTNLELRLKTRSGAYRWYSINSRIQTDKDGSPQRVIGTISDIDDLKNAQLKAAQDVKRRDEFLAMLSHELRNPMAAITFSLDCLNETEGLSDSVVDWIEIISRQTAQMSKLMQDLLDISRLTQNRIVYDFVPHDLNKSVPEAIDSIQPAITGRRQRLNLDSYCEPLMVSGDVARLKQAIVNLLDNASKYTPHEGEIWLETKKHDGQAVISVRDSGFGIEPSTLENIFELFFQESQPLHRKSGGIGVGLFLVDQIVRAHGGTVLAHSEGPGNGSQFTIAVPLTTNRADEIVPPGDLTFEGLQIVIVEDNADSRKSLARLLSQRGASVMEFGDGESAANKLDALEFDVAIIDIGLPGKNGLELAREIRQREHLQQSSLIAMTGYSQNADRESVVAAGFDLHVVKPTNINQLCRAISKSTGFHK